MKKFLIIFFLQINTLFGFDVSCSFEEVYGNGDVQQGQLFFKDQKLRYEYFDKNLFTIIAKNGNYFLIDQAHNNNVSKINKNTEILEMIMSIASEYPNLKNKYYFNDTIVIVEKSKNNFIKRVSINADAVNVSINLISCKFDDIHDKYFNHFNFEKVKK